MSQITQFLLGTGAAPVETLTGDVGAPAVPSAGNINILGGENINTTTPGGGSDVIINLNRVVNLPNTNAAGTEGQYQLGGNRFLHNYGVKNTFVGSESGNLTLTGNSNSGFGSTTLQALTTGSFNTAVGRDALNSNTTGKANTCVGVDAGTDIVNGSFNVAVGHISLQNLVSGNNNICIGFEAGQNYSSNESNNILIGSEVNGTPGENNVIRIGDPGTQTQTFIAGINGASLGASQAMVAIDSTSKLAAIAATANAVQIGAASGSITSIPVGTNGQVLIGATGGAPAFASLTSTGGTIAFTTGPNSLNLEVVGGGSDWIEVTAASATMDSDTGYVTNNAGGVVLTLPAVAAFGSVFRVVGKNASGWLIAQNAGQTIHFGTSNTTTGVAGSLQSTAQYDCVELVCITANTDFVVRSSIGNITVT